MDNQTSLLQKAKNNLMSAWAVVIGMPRLEKLGIDHGYVSPNVSNDDAIEVSIGLGIMSFFAAVVASDSMGQPLVLLATPVIPATYLQLTSKLAARRFERDQAPH